MWAITATYTHQTADGYTGTRQIPTFYLHENVQGIVSESHAIKVARDVLTSCVGEMPANDTLHVHAVYIANRDMFADSTDRGTNDYCPECLEPFSDPELGCDACMGPTTTTTTTTNN